MSILPYLKAFAGGTLAGLTTLGTTMVESSAGGSSIVGSEWVGIAVAALGTFLGVLAIPNITNKEETSSFEGKE